MINILKYFKTIFIFLLILIIYLMLRRIYVDINKNKIFGSDYFMTSLKNVNTYCAGKFKFNNKEKYLKSYKSTKYNVNKYLKDNKLKFFDNYKNIFYEKYVDNIIFQYNKDLSVLLTKEKYNKKLPILIVYNLNKLCCYVIFDHKVHDLISAFKIIKLFNFNPGKNTKPIDYNYIPIYNEIIFLLTIIVNFKKFYFKKINYNIDFTKIKYYKFKVINNEIQNIKKKIKIKSSMISLALSVQKIFNFSKKKPKSIIVGILLGFSNDRFRNNYSILPLKLKYNLELIKIIMNIKKQLKFKFSALGIYDMIKYYTPFEKKVKSKIDVLFTNTFNYEDNYNNYCKSMKIILLNTSIPFYVTSASQNKFTNITIQYKTKNFLVK